MGPCPPWGNVNFYSYENCKKLKEKSKSKVNYVTGQLRGLLGKVRSQRVKAPCVNLVLEGWLAAFDWSKRQMARGQLDSGLQLSQGSQRRCQRAPPWGGPKATSLGWCQLPRRGCLGAAKSHLLGVEDSCQGAAAWGSQPSCQKAAAWGASLQAINTTHPQPFNSSIFH